MDIERIQKINNLALNLMKQGLASDREQAIIQAEKIFQQKDGEDYSSIRETMQEVKNDREEGLRKEETKEQTPDLSQDQIKDILEKNTKYVVKKLREFQEKVIYLEKEVEFLKNRPTSVRTAGELLSSRTTQSKELTDTNETETPISTESQKQSHPRCGNFNQEDVSIEKFFYMGNK